MAARSGHGEVTYLALASPSGQSGTLCSPTAAGAWGPVWRYPLGTQGPAPSLGASRPRFRPAATQSAATASPACASRTRPAERRFRPGQGRAAATHQSRPSSDIFNVADRWGTESMCPLHDQEQAPGNQPLWASSPTGPPLGQRIGCFGGHTGTTAASLPVVEPETDIQRTQGAPEFSVKVIGATEGLLG